MRRRLSLVIAFIGVLGLIGLTPTAQADHANGAKNDGPHENQPGPPVPPDPDGECAVLGDVIIGDEDNQGGVPLVPQSGKNHNHYKFVDTAIICEDNTNPPGMGDDHFDGVFAVEATGGTDGPGECDGMPGKDPKCDSTTHGEDSSAGWSHSSCYAAAPGAAGCVFGAKDPKVTWTVLYAGTKVNPSTNPGGCYNCGEIQVFSLDAQGERDGRKDSTSTDNLVKFCRGLHDDGIHSPAPTCSNIPQGGTTASTGGGNVIAWGQLHDITGKAADEVVCFLADLEFTPRQVFTDASGVVKINAAFLEGTALIWRTDDANKAADCEGKKNKT